MSLITDPWDDEEVDDGQLETQFKQIRICSHRSVCFYICLQFHMYLYKNYCQ